MNILFITHETTRTGSPKVLLLFMKWLKKLKPNLAFDVLALNGGEIEEEFNALVRNYYNFKELTQPKPIKFFQRQLFRLKLKKRSNPKEELLNLLAKNNYDAIYANSAPSLPIASEIKNLISGAKLIFHVHELEVVLKHHLENKRKLFHDVNRFIAVSQMVKTNLIENWNVNEKSIDVVYEFSEIQKPAKPHKDSGEFIVGGAGTVELRKGADLFIRVAKMVFDEKPNIKIKFLWLGKHIDSKFFLHDIDMFKLNEKVSFIGEQKNVNDIFKDFDLLLMTSREDPFPLVCIEAGMLGKPIISFENATGINEILKGAGGLIAPYGDVNEMAKKILLYYEHRKLRHEHGQRNKEIFSRFTPDILCPELFEIVDKTKSDSREMLN